MRNWTVRVLTLLAILHYCSESNAQSITGVITDKLDTPVSEVTVQLISEADTTQRWSSITNASGEYSINSIVTGISDDKNIDVRNLPSDFQLMQNFPNPFNPSSIIPFILKKPGNVKIEVYNILGQRIKTLTNQYYNSGSYQVRWDGSNDLNQMVSGGIYLYRMQAGNQSDARKMVLLDGGVNSDFGGYSSGSSRFSKAGAGMYTIEIAGDKIETYRKEHVTISTNSTLNFIVTLLLINEGYGDFVYVPAGEFEMGDNFDEGFQYELPVHTVYLDAYYIGKYEVTNALYSVFLNEEGNQSEEDVAWIDTAHSRIEYVSDTYRPEPGYEDHPVIELSWYGARAYCTWLTEMTGTTHRLPTEAEWEKAARGDVSHNSALGHQRRYPWGDSIDGSYVNSFNSGDPYDNGTTPVGYFDGSTHGSFVTNDNASPYGAYDMAGNVWEWCSDWFMSDYYADSPAVNPAGPSSGDFRIVRGGCWAFSFSNKRSAGRGTNDQSYSSTSLGFRCVRED